MQSEDIAVLGSIAAFMGGVIAITTTQGARQHAEKKERLLVLREALQRPDLDDATRRQILAVLTDEHRGRFARLLGTVDFWARAAFAVGWLLFILFGGMSLAAVADLAPLYVVEFSVPIGLLGLALMTLPVALRESARRGDGQPTHRRT